jgi:hypothetical protein
MWTPKLIVSMTQKLGTPDIHRKELQYALFVAYNVDIEVSTITRVLYRRGFTRKKVGFFYYY